MSRSNRVGGLMLTMFAVVALIAAGCSKDDNKGDQAKSKDGQAEKKDNQVAKEDTKKGHEGWWCEEHGVPEKDCSLCMSEADAKARFKDKGDWCQLHDRARSQCFKCEPSLWEKNFVPLYEVKYGKKPPRPPESEFQK